MYPQAMWIVRRSISAGASSHRCCRFVSRAHADLARRPRLAGRPYPIPGGGGRLPSPSPRLRPRPGGFGGVRLLAGGPGRVVLLGRGLGFGGLLLLARGLLRVLLLVRGLGGDGLLRVRLVGLGWLTAWLRSALV